MKLKIALLHLEKSESKPLNSIILFDKSGALKLHYSKVHTCAFADEKVLSPGEDFYVTENCTTSLIRIQAA